MMRNSCNADGLAALTDRRARRVHRNVIVESGRWGADVKRLAESFSHGTITTKQLRESEPRIYARTQPGSMLDAIINEHDSRFAGGWTIFGPNDAFGDVMTVVWNRADFSAYMGGLSPESMKNSRMRWRPVMWLAVTLNSGGAFGTLNPSPRFQVAVRNGMMLR